MNSENLTNKEGENPVNKEEKQKGRYHNDYSPRYQEAYDIYEKAKAHMKKRKKEEKKRTVPPETIRFVRQKKTSQRSKEAGSCSLFFCLVFLLAAVCASGV